MKKEILITILCTGLIIVTPIVVVARENTISNNLLEQPYVGELVAQIRTTINEILEEYGKDSKISNMCSVILFLLYFLARIALCILIFILAIPVLIFYFIALIKGDMNLIAVISNIQASILMIIELCSPIYFKYQPKITKLVNGCPCLQL
jgi:hypothetical protein